MVVLVDPRRAAAVAEVRLQRPTGKAAAKKRMKPKKMKRTEKRRKMMRKRRTNSRSARTSLAPLRSPPLLLLQQGGSPPPALSVPAEAFATLWQASYHHPPRPQRLVVVELHSFHQHPLHHQLVASVVCSGWEAARQQLQGRLHHQLYVRYRRFQVVEGSRLSSLLPLSRAPLRRHRHLLLQLPLPQAARWHRYHSYHQLQIVPLLQSMGRVAARCRRPLRCPC
jgi:hypothetical protein